MKITEAVKVAHKISHDLQEIREGKPFIVAAFTKDGKGVEAFNINGDVRPEHCLAFAQILVEKAMQDKTNSSGKAEDAQVIADIVTKHAANVAITGGYRNRKSASFADQ